MKRFLFNLLWYLGIVVLVDVLSFMVFFLLHGAGSVGTKAPFVIAAALFFTLVTVQAFLHLYILERRSPERERANVWTVILVTSLGFATMPLLIAGLMVAALKTPMQ